MITLDALTEQDVQAARTWRNADPTGLRTPFPLTASMQADFYRTVVCDRGAPHRYLAARDTEQVFVAMTGLTNLQWENRLAEISLITNPHYRKQGLGQATVAALLEVGFQQWGLLTIYGECYHCSPAVGFWRSIVARYRGNTVVLPRRKWWQGRLWDADYFTLTPEALA